MQRIWRRPAAIAAVVLALAVSGLGAGFALNYEGDDSTDADELVRETTVAAKGTAGFSLPLDRLTVPYPRPEFISEFQWAMIDDGWITDEEVLAARNATVACIAREGLDVRPLEWEPGSSSAPSFVIVSKDPGPHPAAERCQEQYQEFVGMAYGSQGDRRPWVTADELDSQMRTCLAKQGVQIDAGQTYEEFMTDERFQSVIADPAELGKHEDCWRRVGGAVRSLGREDEPVTAVAGWQACLAEHGYAVAAPGHYLSEFWTPERLNAVPSVPGLEAVWQKCRVVTMAEALANR